MSSVVFVVVVIVNLRCIGNAERAATWAGPDETQGADSI